MHLRCRKRAKMYAMWDGDGDSESYQGQRAMHNAHVGTVMMLRGRQELGEGMAAVVKEHSGER